ncbi:MAG: imidazole glycerol phosphate synthase subunit HisH [Rhodospirillales bacterium]|nr:imidazole glycerol phosphate synthase subunit HisH [Alphaproteobacteria bacterium]MBL6948856.1 imidazole glycerol phosphate synthase subunit HisH [Rhodospirillales bacterium]
MTIAIIDYGSGNLRSAAKAFERAVDDAGLGLKVVVTRDPADLKAASHIVLPGVGAFADCRKGLAAVDGMEAALQDQVITGKKPFLGICVGMQLMADIGREHGDMPGLGWVPGEVIAMTPSDKALKIPHMGWNDLTIKAPPHPFLEGIKDGSHVYFVHSYVFHAADPSDVLATVDYGGPVTAVIGRDNLVGTQFHPEKSQAVGLRLISNFLQWQP